MELRRVLDRVLPPEHFGPFEYAAKFKASQRIEGDYPEFGVYTGRSFITAYKLIKKAERFQKSRTRFIAFDGFNGSDPGCRLLDEFVNNLRRHKVDLQDVITVEGLFRESLTKELADEIELHKVAIVFFDCTSAGTALALDFVTDYLVDGAILIFDQWFASRANPNRGQQFAFREWASRNPELGFSDFVSIESGYVFHGMLKSIIVHRQ